MISLRAYQQQAVTDVIAGFAEFNRQLLVFPTGGGKTIVFSACAQRVMDGALGSGSKRTLILAHREELVDQAIQKLHAATGIFAGKEKAECKASLNDGVVVASVQSMERRLGKWPVDHFGLAVADEAHHAVSQSWQRVLRHFNAKVLGVTATPDRGDRRNLGEYFENVAAEVSLFDLVNDGFLSRISVRSVPLSIDLTKVRQVCGDFSEADLGDALMPYLGPIAKAIQSEAAFRRTLVFLPLIATSKAFTEACKAEGISACHIDGNSPDRKEILERFADGQFEVLSNAMLLTEGFDDPGIDCVVILRPTRSRSLYSQMVGRGTRVFPPFKRDLLLLDFLWLHEKHNLIRPAHLVARSQEEADAITELSEKPGGEVQEEFDLEDLANEVRRQREQKLKEELSAKANRKAKSIDALDFCLSLGSLSVAEYEPEMKWEAQPITDRQRGILSKWGFDMDGIRDAGHASKIIDLIISRSKLDLATPKQVRMLRQFGHKDAERKSFKEASALIGEFLDKQKPRKVAA